MAGGIAVIHVSQDLVSSFSVAAGTQNVTTTTTKETGSGTGLYAAIDIIYNLAARYGVGGYVRYAGAKVDLPAAAIVDANVGGMQAGGGIRLRF